MTTIVDATRAASIANRASSARGWWLRVATPRLRQQAPSLVADDAAPIERIFRFAGAQPLEIDDQGGDFGVERGERATSATAIVPAAMRSASARQAGSGGGRSGVGSSRS